MNLTRQIKQLPFIEKAAPEVISSLIQVADIIELEKDDYLVKQFDIGKHLYFLLSGELGTLIPLKENNVEHNIGTVKIKNTPIGWSAFRSPARYTTTYIAHKKTQLLRLPIQPLTTLINQNPEFGNDILSFIYTSCLPVLEEVQNQTRPFFSNESLAFDETRPLEVTSCRNYSTQEAFELIKSSAFFEGFNQQEKRIFSKSVSYFLVNQGDIISQQEKASDGLYLLIQGKVIVSYQTNKGRTLTTRTISRKGTVLSWTAPNQNINNRTSIIASRDSSILYISQEKLDNLLALSPKIKHKFWYRLIWLVGTHLLAARMRLLSQTLNNEVTAVSNVIAQNAALLSVSSPLYKISELLKSQITTNEAFGLIYKSLHFGNALEKTIAGMCLDILKDVQRENGFYLQLQKAYDRVNGLDVDTPKTDIRRENAQRFKQAFEKVPYVIKGLENLPKKAGSLFIYNHLANAASTTLPNGFNFPLDAQFISALIIDNQYGVTGLRVVGRSNKNEYWRDDYYQKFGHIFVDSWESLGQDEASYESFLNDATSVINDDIPLLISPEGARFTTEESPSIFGESAFTLTQSSKLDEEPWIVPIAVANFDKRVDHTIYSVVIKPAFKLSDRVNLKRKDSLTKFLKKYQNEFKGYVNEARQLARDIAITPSLSHQPGYRSNMLKLNQVEAEFESDVRALESQLAQITNKNQAAAFYGSSTFKLWENMQHALGHINTVNLGFGGATLEACVYYFERLVVAQQPKSLVLYLADNDIGNRQSYNQIAEHYIQLLEKIDQHFTDLPVAIVSVKPSPARMHHQQEIIKVNKLLERLAFTRPNTAFIDIYSAFFNKDKKLKTTLFCDDELHLNEKGYALISQCILAFENFIFHKKT
ncbi:hypothetical protein MED121_13970 [Marinomonas sp. MED121]|uniref:cyclic nucleotide-binding domain-containing protein n=1 Tax=Marinomonas sp. MED121 TaxID=314277 RepID=UPI000068FED3|nr:cyclic nucleotide-binding domain-containing protein [Marinomonas sp. MED121]EAQ67040.1 hypothetical protein MED121_13970 [Marinomonas sp. MED121]